VQYSSIVDRIAGKSVSAWNVHYEALARVAAGEDVIVLSVGQETNETTPRVVVEAGVRSMRAGRHHYTDVQGELALREGGGAGVGVGGGAECSVLGGAVSAGPR
jgi:arginine:pyruvate transaminase